MARAAAAAAAPPSVCRAFHQQISWLGHAGRGRAIAPLIPQLLPCRSEGGALYVRPQPFALPLSFPQFFSSSVGVHGEVRGAPNEFVGRALRPELAVAPPHRMRAPTSEVLSAPIAAGLQCTPAIMPVLRRVIADWNTDRRAAERAAEGWAQRDELAELETPPRCVRRMARTRARRCHQRLVKRLLISRAVNTWYCTVATLRGSPLGLSSGGELGRSRTSKFEVSERLLQLHSL